VGLIVVLRMVRDWSSEKRAGAARAREAEARADAMRAVASRYMAEAEIVQWLAREGRAGRVPTSDLLALVRHDDLDALNRLADGDVTLGLPPGVNPGGPGS
jgi:hypothetical protein